MGSENREWSGGGLWMLSNFLLVLAAAAGLVATLFAVWGAFQQPGDLRAATLIAAATPIALGAIAFAAVGGILRYSCCGWGECDWDGEDDTKNAMTGP